MHICNHFRIALALQHVRSGRFRWGAWTAGQETMNLGQVGLRLLSADVLRRLNITSFESTEQKQ